MTKSYHVNLETGEVGKCEATLRSCPISGEHFATENQAEAFKTGFMESVYAPFASVSKSKTPPQENNVHEEDKNVILAPLEMNLSEDTQKVLKALQDAGMEPLIVGGAVRDQLMGFESKDIDIEIYGAESFEEISKAVKKLGRTDVTGKEFGVLKLTMGEDDFDLSLPRRENKIGAGHKGFAIEVDPKLSKTAATARRDFTINALLWNPVTKQVEDYHGGLEDMKYKELRATSEAFGEDPLRVLRGAQFSARFGFYMDSNTIQASQELLLEFDTIPEDRIYVEMKKMYTKGEYMGNGVDALVQTGWFNKIYGNDVDPQSEETSNFSQTLDNIATMKESHGQEFTYLSSVAYTADFVGLKQQAKTGSYVAKQADYKKAAKMAKFIPGESPETNKNSEVRAFARKLQDEGGMTVREYAMLRSYSGKNEEKLIERAKALNVFDGSEKDNFDAGKLAKESGLRGPAIREYLEKVRMEQYSRDD